MAAEGVSTPRQLSSWSKELNSKIRGGALSAAPTTTKNPSFELVVGSRAAAGGVAGVVLGGLSLGLQECLLFGRNHAPAGMAARIARAMILQGMGWGWVGR